MLAVGEAAKVRLLLEKGADVNAKSKQGHTALDIAAGREGSVEVVNVRAKDGETALTLAGRKGKTEIVRLLEQSGVKE
jgi:ankyrin repeat protein